MTVSFGTPGALRKTVNDGGYDLLKFSGEKIPCPLKAGVDPATAVKDGLFLAPDGAGKYEAAATPDRGLVMVFTANTDCVVKLVTDANEFPGEDRTDTVTGLFGFVEGIWPVSRLFIGATGGGTVALADYAAFTKLTVKSGKLCPANFGTNAAETVIGTVLAPAATVTCDSICARVEVK